MLKWLLILALFSVGGYYAYLYAHPEKRACARLMSELCHRSGDPPLDRAKCETMLRSLKDQDSSAADSSVRCIAESQTCGAAVGCVAGSVSKAGVGFFGEFLKGAEKTFSGK